VAVGRYENVWVTFERAVTVDGVANVLGDATRTPFVCYMAGRGADSIRRAVQDDGDAGEDAGRPSAG
jgi:hypothetical protein